MAADPNSPPRIAAPIEFVRPQPESAHRALAPTNRLIHADDNLHALTALLAGDDQHPSLAGQVDLIYIDPPFAVQGAFNSAVEIAIPGAARPLRLTLPAYDDTWPAGLTSYLAMMRERLLLLHALLKPTGALYLHCDWHASHYLKVLLDDIFGAENFRNEIVWAYRSGGASRSASLPRKHDVIYLYGRSAAFTIRPQTQRQYLEKPFMGSQRDAHGRHYVDTLLRDVLEGEILLVEGQRLVSYNTRPVLNLSAERSGFPTQKPLGLLRLLLKIASDPGALLLDAFCGSGSAALAAETLTDDLGHPAPRQWIAVDRGTLAIATARKRLIAANARPFTVERLGAILPAPPMPQVELAIAAHDATVVLTLQRVTLDLDRHLRALAEPKRAHLAEILTANWPSLIDTWSIDWDHHDGAPFDAQWRTVRTRQTHDLPLTVTHAYATPGEKCIAVYLTDVFGATALIHLRITL